MRIVYRRPTYRRTCRCWVAGIRAALANDGAGHLHVDETTWRVFEEAAGKENHRCWLWTFVGPDTVCFAVDPTHSRKALTPQLDTDAGSLAENRHLLVSSDFFSVYRPLATIEGVDPLWCWAHIRRYFIRAADAHKELKSWYDRWLVRIGALYVAHRVFGAAEAGRAEQARAETDFARAQSAIAAARKAEMADETLHPAVKTLRPAVKKALATLDHDWAGHRAPRRGPGAGARQQPPPSERFATRWCSRRTATGRAWYGRDPCRSDRDHHRDRSAGGMQPARPPLLLSRRLRKRRWQGAKRAGARSIPSLGSKRDRPRYLAGRAARTGAVSRSLLYCGRDFTEDELELVGRLAGALPTHRAIADALCEELAWLRPDGRHKDMSARVAPGGEDQGGLQALEGADRDLPLPRLRALRRRAAALPPLRGPHALGALGFAASAWKCAPRDAHVGWDKPTRETRLHLVVSNARFLILLHEHVKNLVSHVLAKAARRLARRLRLRAGALGDLRRDLPVQRSELSGGKLDLGRPDHRTRQARPGPRARAPCQERLPTPSPARLPQHPQLASVTSTAVSRRCRPSSDPVRVHRIFTMHRRVPRVSFSIGGRDR